MKQQELREQKARSAWSRILGRAEQVLAVPLEQHSACCQ